MTNLESVKLDLAGREKSWRGCGGLLEGPDDWDGGSLLRSLESSLVSGQESGLSVAGIERVDKWVDSGAVGAFWDEVGSKVGGSWGVLWGEGSSVDVEGKVTVGWIVGVDKGVAVGVILNFVVVIDNWLSWDDWDLGRLNWDLLFNWCGLINFALGVEGSSLLSVGWDVGALENPESVLASAVPHSVGLAIFSDVRVFSDAVSVDVGLLAEDVSILSGESSSSTTVSSVETLFLEDLGVLGVNELGAACSNGNTYDKL
jgi:hypothetical protein